MARYIENLNSCTDPVSGDYLWIVDASAGSTDKDRKVDIAKFGIVSATTTWTPVLYFGTGNTGMAGTFTGTCVRIGNLVAVYCTFALTAKGSSTGNAKITGLPFAAAVNTPVCCRWQNMTSSMIVVAGLCQTNSEMPILGTTAAAANLNSITDAAFSDTSALTFSGVYIAA